MVFLAYLLELDLDKHWRHLEAIVAVGIDEPGSIRGTEIAIGQATCQKVPEPADLIKQLLDAAAIELPEILPREECMWPPGKSWFLSGISFNLQGQRT